MKSEKKIKHEILSVIGKRDDVRLFPISVGLVVSLQNAKDDKPLRPFRSAPKGFPDICGIMKNGKFLAVEVKSGVGKMRSEQRAFKKMVLDMDGVHVVARCVEDVEKVLEYWWRRID